MKRTLYLAAAILCAATAGAGTVEIAAECHTVSFAGLEDRVETYTNGQKERFEPVDEAIVKKLREKDAVWVEAFPSAIRCLAFPPVPKKLVLTERGKSDPVFTLDLERRDLPLQNRSGAKVVLVKGTAWMTKEDLMNLDRDLDIHLIYDGREPSKEKWKALNVRKILGPATTKK